MKLLTFDAVMEAIAEVEQSLSEATEPTPDERYAIEYTIKCVKRAIVRKYEPMERPK